MQLLNEAQIYDQWAPILEEKIGITDRYKKSWMAKYCHFHTLNENFSYGTSVNLGNVPGMGPVRPGAAPGGVTAFNSAGAKGSGDKFPSLLPLSIQVGARTVGFDIVSVIPMPGPTGVLTYLDYVYAGGKPGSESKPTLIKINSADLSGGHFTNGTHYWGVNSATGGNAYYASGSKAVELIFVGYSRIDGYPIFRVGETYTTANTSNTWTKDATITLADVFNQTAVIAISTSGKPDQTAYVWNAAATTKVVSVSAKPELVRALEDHVQGPAGAGTFDQDNWTGNYVDGTNPANPMGRGTGESTYYRMLGLTAYTKFVEAETFQFAASVTTEQIQDLNKQYGIDVISMVENALVNEISQSINKNILSRAFALGWSNNSEMLATEGVTLNFTLDRSITSNGTSPAYLNKLGFGEAIAYNAYADLGDFENLHTIQRRISSKVLAASNIIYQRGRRGQANFIVTNAQIATALQDSAQFTFAPMNNTINQSGSGLYPVGTLANMTIYVDPNMTWDDTRILVGRKGADEEPGLKFLPYLMAESISTIAEGTMSPKVAVKTRYALVEAGQWPETQYLTIYLNLNGMLLV